MINTPSINNNVPTIQQKEKPVTTPNNGGRKQQETLVSVVTTDLSAIANETLPYKGETNKQEQRTKGLFAAKRGFKKGEDPISMILGNGESPGGRKKGLPHSFFCTQKHNPKKVGDGNSTICTAIDMKEVDSKSYMKSYNLTDQHAVWKVRSVFS